jgi:hypothetical protein
MEYSNLRQARRISFSGSVNSFNFNLQLVAAVELGIADILLPEEKHTILG